MNRRDVLGVLAGAGLTGLAGCLGGGTGGGSSESTTDESGTESSTTASDTGDLPLTVDTIDAQGSTAGEMQIPVDGTPTVLDLFATWCAPCVAQMESLRALHTEFGDD
ncbi:TlpA family protein disulfide reductase, partial [Haloferax profundi]|uniref:TlpA family protein disulfide reductase n=1 Tax=Haloferax profundi TaxID=1544718 RepID=UPI000A789B94